MNKWMKTLTAALCLALLAGCGAETSGESLDADEMHPGWSTVTTDPSAYGITYQELEDLPEGYEVPLLPLGGFHHKEES